MFVLVRQCVLVLLFVAAVCYMMYNSVVAFDRVVLCVLLFYSCIALVFVLYCNLLFIAWMC